MEAGAGALMFGRQFPLQGGPRNFAAVEICAPNTEMVNRMNHGQMCTSTSDVYTALWNSMRNREVPEEMHLELARQLLSVRERAMMDDVAVMSTLRNTVMATEAAKARYESEASAREHTTEIQEVRNQLAECELRATHLAETNSVLVMENEALKRAQEGTLKIERTEDEFEDLRDKVREIQAQYITAIEERNQARREMAESARVDRATGTGPGQEEERVRLLYGIMLGMLRQIAGRLTDDDRSEALASFCDQLTRPPLSLPISELVRALKPVGTPKPKGSEKPRKRDDSTS
jgi:hypothetical protein